MARGDIKHHSNLMKNYFLKVDQSKTKAMNLFYVAGLEDELRAAVAPAAMDLYMDVAMSGIIQTVQERAPVYADIDRRHKAES